MPAALIALLSLWLGFVAPSSAGAQVDPSHKWLTIRTKHFFVHFTAPTEGLARRVAANAERAYEQLSRDYRAPRGMIDIVVSDDVDLSNGSATPYPTNRIVIYANPPVSESALRYTNDWSQSVVTHELTHIFHLDRTRGVWSLGQFVFGRAAALFPNFYSPSWLTEGLAVHQETRLAGAGRIEGSEHRMIARAAAIDHAFPTIGAISLAQGRFPFGESAYAFGSLFVEHLATRYGEPAVRRFVDKSAAELIPYLPDIPARGAFGVSFSRSWRDFNDSVTRSIRTPEAAPMNGWRELTRDGAFVYSPRWLSDSSIVYTGTPGREAYGAYRVGLDGRRQRIGRRNSQSANVPIGANEFLYSQVDFASPYQQRSDLWIQRGGREHQLTFGQRLTSPDARVDGEIVATQILPGATRIVRVSRDGARITPITSGSYDEQWTEPRWSHSGEFIAVSRWRRGNVSQIVILDTLGRTVHVVSSGISIEATPSWLSGDSGIIYSSDRTGTAQLYVEKFGSPGVFAEAQTYRLSDVQTGIFEPIAAPDSDLISAVHFRSNGYHLGVARCCAPDVLAPTPAFLDSAPRRLAPLVVDSSVAKPFRAWRSFIPRYWLPEINDGIDGGYRLGGTTSGFDVIGRHSMTARIGIPTNGRGGIVGGVTYQYAGLGIPVLQFDASQDWQSLGGITLRDPPRTIIGELFRRTWTADALATWLRQRYRTSMSLSAGAGVERLDHVTSPGGLIPQIDTTGRFGTLTYPNLVVAGGFANYQRPSFSISPEDGVQLSVTVRDRLRSGILGTGGQNFSTVGALALYKSLDLPGYAHHVLALRGAAGWADDNSSGYFSVGGVSGTTFQVIPGYTLGEGRKTFPVRGYSVGSLLGTRALAGSAEYRLPLFMPGRSPGILPFFFDRTAFTIFGDYGTAWCPNVEAGRQVCSQAGQDRRSDIGSVGAELNLNLGVFSWDSPSRFRLGVVHPLRHADAFGREAVQVFIVSGLSF